MGISVRPWKPAERRQYAKLDNEKKQIEEARKKVSAELKKKTK